MSEAGRPSRIRYLVVGSTALMSVLLYLDRYCISFAEGFIQDDLGLTDVQVGWMLSAFFWTYALAQVPAGWLTDRFGSRLMLTTYILGWSLFTGLTGLAGGFFVLLLLRLGFGLAQAGAYPTGASVISKWAPFSQRGIASSVVAVGGRVGGWLALYATGFVIVWLTPDTTPAVFAPRDILNPTRLASEIDSRAAVSGPQASIVRRLREGLTTEQLAAIEQAGAGAADSSGTGDSAGTAGANEVTAEQRDALAIALNRVVEQRDFFDAGDLKGLKLEREAVRLSSMPREELSEQQARRLNRLVLEALFGEDLKKLYGAGWRPMMWFYAALGLVVGGLVWWSCRDRPADHPACNQAEIELIESDPRMTANAGPVGGAPLRELVSSRSMWLCCISQWFTNVGWVFVMTWAPRYFEAVHNVPIERRALLVSIPPLVGWLGMLWGGRLTDQLAQRLGLRWGRAMPMSLSRFLAMGAYVACLFQPSPWLAVFLFSIVTFATDLGTGAVWAFTQDVGGRRVGSVLGWGNMWGNLGAAVTPPILIAIVGTQQNWTAAFAACAVAFFISGVAALGVDATIPIVKEVRRTSDDT
jgi:MFS family permease